MGDFFGQLFGFFELPDRVNYQEPPVEAMLIFCEGQIHEVLGRFEPQVMALQSLLIWERPWLSVLFFASVHCCFWLATSHELLSIVAAVALFVVLCELAHRLVYGSAPLVPRPEPMDDTADGGADDSGVSDGTRQRYGSGWTGRLTSTAEMARPAAQAVVCACVYVQAVWKLRRNSRFKFGVLAVSVLALLTLAGHYISGAFLCYITIVSLLLWPSVVYHNWLKRLYLLLEPVLMQIEYNLKIKRRIKKGRRKLRKRTRIGTSASTGVGKMQITEIDELSDSDEANFVPLDPEVTAALAHLITDSEEEGSADMSSRAGSPSVSVSRAGVVAPVPTAVDHLSLPGEPHSGNSSQLSDDDASLHEFLLRNTAVAGLPPSTAPSSSADQARDDYEFREEQLDSLNVAEEMPSVSQVADYDSMLDSMLFSGEELHKVDDNYSDEESPEPDTQYSVIADATVDEQRQDLSAKRGSSSSGSDFELVSSSDVAPNCPP